MQQHIPVLTKEVLTNAQLQPGDDVIDATLGHGGHAAEMLHVTAPTGRLLGVDRDPKQAEIAKGILAAFGARVRIAAESFADINAIAAREGFTGVAAVVMDLGMSSWHLEESGKGFSFQKNEPLSMRYAETGATAYELINGWPPEELAHIFSLYGEEPFAERVANRIVASRQTAAIETTGKLAEVVAEAFPIGYRARSKKHPATRVFQALRIAVNDELGHIERGLPAAFGVLKHGGRLLVISFHSLEDRLVKNFFRDLAKTDKARLITKKPVRAGIEELAVNPRSRSAKLRVLEKV